jgi:hypothetical protein
MPTITRFVALADGRSKATFADGTVAALASDARAYVIVAPAAAAADTAAAAAATTPPPPTPPTLHTTDLALRHHRPYLAQALAVRSANQRSSLRPHAPAWLDGDDKGAAGSSGGAPPASAAAAKAELLPLLLLLPPPLTSSKPPPDPCRWWLDPHAELPPPSGGLPGAAAALLLWTPRAVLSLRLAVSLPLPLPPPPSPPVALEAEAHVASGDHDPFLGSQGGGDQQRSYSLRTVMGGQFFELRQRQEEQDDEDGEQDEGKTARGRGSDRNAASNKKTRPARLSCTRARPCPSASRAWRCGCCR